ncbi:iron-siderophore ABC transporter substrate-binding protein [uncultured Corynebacterium sp.]|uniref:iron-siderophore ABC transporter substrate-binding protein n=1 Tax=uncultured Corynebacterium sp. TaxID=159447 RepID=UPI0025F8EFB5|nr:iron-siderophore ABC transporter substrate-binding protein [uncultured Corynebacterium sp.]
MNVKDGRSRGLKVAALATVVALALTGCSRGDGETGAEADGTGAGDERIAAVGLGDADTLLALGVEPVLVAPWDAEGDAGEIGVGPWSKDLLGDARPAIVHGTGTGFTAEAVEKITAADPTKIIAVNHAIDDQAKADLEAIAPVTLHDDAYPDWQVPWKSQVTTIADAVGKQGEGERLIADTEAKFDDFAEKHPDTEGKTAAVVMPYGGKIGLYTDGDGRGQFIENLGYTIPDELQATEDGSFHKDFAPENYDALNDVDILFVLDYMGAAEELKKDPTFMNLDIVKDGRVRFLDTDTGNAMSMPNPVTIPWVIEKFDDQL